MTIARIGEHDWERFRALRLEALRDAPDAFGSTYAEEAAQPPDAWRRHLRKATAATWIASIDGCDAGVVVGDAYAGRTGAAGLFGMWVSAECRGRGLGDLLVESVVRWAREQGHELILLDVGDENVPACRLYERHGFLPTGETGVVAPSRPHIHEHELALRLA